MKPLLPSFYEVSNVRPRVLKLATSSLRLLYRYSGDWYDMVEQQSSSAAAAVTTPPATQITSTTVAQARAPLNNFVSTLEMSAEEKATAPHWNLLSRHYYAQGTFTKM